MNTQFGKLAAWFALAYPENTTDVPESPPDAYDFRFCAVELTLIFTEPVLVPTAAVGGDGGRLSCAGAPWGPVKPS